MSAKVGRVHQGGDRHCVGFPLLGPLGEVECPRPVRVRSTVMVKSHVFFTFVQATI